MIIKLQRFNFQFTMTWHRKCTSSIDILYILTISAIEKLTILSELITPLLEPLKFAVANRAMSSSQCLKEVVIRNFRLQQFVRLNLV